MRMMNGTEEKKEEKKKNRRRLLLVFAKQTDFVLMRLRHVGTRER